MADPSSNTKLPLVLLRQIDGLCAKFEAALRAGKRPDPAKALEQIRSLESDERETSVFPQARRKLLRELLLLELEYRARRNMTT